MNVVATYRISTLIGIALMSVVFDVYFGRIVVKVLSGDPISVVTTWPGAALVATVCAFLFSTMVTYGLIVIALRRGVAIFERNGRLHYTFWLPSGVPMVDIERVDVEAGSVQALRGRSLVVSMRSGAVKSIPIAAFRESGDHIVSRLRSLIVDAETG